VTTIPQPRHILLVALAAVALLASPGAFAQAFSGDWDKELLKDRPAPKRARDAGIERDILALQDELRRAGAARDLAKVRSFFADDSTMTHGAGMVDDADGRAKWITDGTRFSFETMPIMHQSIRVIAPDAVVAILNSRYSMQGRTGAIRYMIVYGRGKRDQGYKGWRQVAAHVNNIPDR
jgi:hypothetical protein